MPFMDSASTLRARYTPSGSYANRPWFCLKAKPRQEPIAVSELRNQDFPAFWPIKAGGNGVEGLFPGYLFAQPLDDGSWAPMRYTRGVASLIMSAPSRPSYLPSGAMEELCARLSDDGIMWPAPTINAEAGGQLRVIDSDSPFAGFVAQCSRTARDRVFALMQIMGTKQEIDFHRSQVEAA
jgi:transcriptional antiterminator RfaH